MRGRQTFLSAGGDEFVLIPRLNDHPLWLSGLENIVRRFFKQPDPAQERCSVGQNRLSRQRHGCVALSR